MKKKYSRALAVMCAVTMALPSSAYITAYADDEITENQNIEEGGNQEAGAELENGTHKFSFDELTVAADWTPGYTVGEDGKLTINYDGQYQQLFFALPEGVDPARVSGVELVGVDGEDVVLKVETSVNGTELTNYSHSVTFESGSEYSIIDIMYSGTTPQKVTIDAINITLTDAPSNTKVVTYKLSELGLASDGGANIEDYTVTFTNSYQSVFFDFSDVLEEGMVPVQIDIKGDASTFNYKVMTQEQFETDPWGNGVAVSYGNPTITFDNASARYLIVMSGDTPDDPDAEEKTYGKFEMKSEIEVTLAKAQGVQMDLIN